MQLLYIYIGGYIDVNEGPYKGDASDKPYRVLKNIELNFSNKFIFEFNKEKCILDVKDNDSYVSNFFDSEAKIKSISAIIGKNGTGKTSIIELIKSLQPDNIHNIPYKLILVYGDINTETNQDFTILKHHELACKLSEKFEQNNIQDFYGNNYGVIKKLKPFILPHKIENFTQIYYSPIFEVQFSNLQAEHEVYGDTNLFDISTSNLIEKDAENSINGPIHNLNSREVLVRHKMADVERQYNLVLGTTPFEELLGFKKPGVIELIIDTSDFKSIKEDSLIQKFDSIFPKDATLFTMHTQNYFCFQLLKHSLYNFFRSLPSNSILDSPETIIKQIIAVIPIVSNKTTLNNWITDFKENCTTIKFHYKDRLIQRFEFVLKFFSLDEVDKKFRHANNIRCRLNLQTNFDKQILEDYFKIKHLTGFLHLDWKFDLHSNGQLSSGEKSKFNLFSRFHSVIKNAEMQSKTLSNLIILLDEGDTLFHPEWQRTYLNDFINGIKIIFKDSKSIQIILTTHSPFVTSDLPWYSTIKLDKDNNTDMTLVNYNNDNPTFAANIHDLFTDSFYMEKGFVGEFARNKINNLFDRVSTMCSKENSIEIQKEIDLIGEPFIRTSLKKHFQNQLKSHE